LKFWFAQSHLENAFPTLYFVAQFEQQIPNPLKTSADVFGF
jgi:hypothetical protein